ncbi:hypothetical protein BHE74_00030360 [Ensete ventricosum]|nr:hypothetical protein BHE74_00030360 [Ensete ventricosum]
MFSFCIHVGFKREQIKLLIDDYGKLKISGERPLINDRWKRFLKEFYVPDYSNVSEISAQFENGLLRIILPKFVAQTSTKDEAAKASEAAPDRKTTTETNADGSKSDTTQKTKSRSDDRINKQPKDERKKESLDASKDAQKVEEKEKGNDDGKIHEEGAETRKKKKAMTQEQAPAGGHGRMLGDLKNVQRLGSGLYRRMRVMVTGVLTIVVLVGLPKHCNIEQLRAKFDQEILYVVLPKPVGARDGQPTNETKQSGGVLKALKEVIRTFGLTPVVTLGVVESYDELVGAVVWGEDVGQPPFPWLSGRDVVEAVDIAAGDVAYISKGALTSRTMQSFWRWVTMRGRGSRSAKNKQKKKKSSLYSEPQSEMVASEREIKKKKMMSDSLKKGKSKTKFQEFLELETGKGVLSGEEDLEMEKRLSKKLKVKDSKLRGPDDGINFLIDGSPSEPYSMFDDDTCGEDEVDDDVIEENVSSMKKKHKKKKKSSDASIEQLEHEVAGGEDEVDDDDVMEENVSLLKKMHKNKKKLSDASMEQSEREVVVTEKGTPEKVDTSHVDVGQKKRKKKNSLASEEHPVVDGDAKKLDVLDTEETHSVEPATVPSVKYMPPQVRARLGIEFDQLLEIRRRVKSMNTIIWLKIKFYVI